MGSCNRWNTVILETSGSQESQTRDGVTESGTSCGMSKSFIDSGGNDQQHAAVSSAEGSKEVIAASNIIAGTSFTASSQEMQTPQCVSSNRTDTSCGMSLFSSQDIGEQSTQGFRALCSGTPNQRVKRRKIMDTLRPVQMEALQFIEAAEHHAIIIMPTGSGKTTLMWSYKSPSRCSLVFAPFKILVQQLGSVLAQKGKVVAFPIVSNDGDIFGILATADFIILPYEAAPTSADLVASLYELERLGPIWVDEVHNLATTGRFRTSLDSFWNLGAELQVRGVNHRMIGLSATLRPDDVSDVMRRMSIASVDVYRQSCFRPGLALKFPRPFGYEKDMIKEACSLALGFVKEGKVLVFTSTVNLCDIMGDKIRARFSG